MLLLFTFFSGSKTLLRCWAKIGVNNRGSWSTMCGNGLIALGTQLSIEMPSTSVFNVITGSGKRIISPKQGLIEVEMGRLSSSNKDFCNLARGISNDQMIEIPIPLKIQKNISIAKTSWSFGMVGDTSLIGITMGEPHCIVFVEGADTISELRKIALENGKSIIQHMDLFPYGMNINFAVVKNIDYEKKLINFLLCTYERNLGDNPDVCVTGACGTGATSTFGVLLEYKQLLGDWEANITSTGGITTVKRKSNIYKLFGKAKYFKNQL